MTSASTSSMVMDMSTTATTSAAAATTSSSMDMGMDMGMGGNACKINMLWNWYTVDACFLSSSWHITSSGMFAGSCIGVICLVILLEFLRRTGKEYDRLLLRDAQRRHATVNSSSSTAGSVSSGIASSSNDTRKGASAQVTPQQACAPQAVQFRPSVVQQAIRALLHMLQFAVAYFIMLLAMYFNGYIIISIFIGAYLGFFIFGWETVTLSGPQEEVTVCCG